MQHDNAFQIIAYHARIYAPDGNVLSTYRDHYDRLAIGFDHTRGTLAEQTITEDMAHELFAADVVRLIEKIVPLIEGATLHENQWNALLSFAHSMKFSDFAQTTVVARIRCRRMADVGAEMMKHVEHDARALRLLMRRRESEVALWNMAAR